VINRVKLWFSSSIPSNRSGFKAPRLEDVLPVSCLPGYRLVRVNMAKIINLTNDPENIGSTRGDLSPIWEDYVQKQKIPSTVPNVTGEMVEITKLIKVRNCDFNVVLEDNNIWRLVNWLPIGLVYVLIKGIQDSALKVGVSIPRVQTNIIE
jgi:hypothetical protein